MLRREAVLISSHNLPPSETNTRERGVGWGHPRPRQVASPPAPLLYDRMSEAVSLTRGSLYLTVALSESFKLYYKEGLAPVWKKPIGKKTHHLQISFRL